MHKKVYVGTWIYLNTFQSLKYYRIDCVSNNENIKLEIIRYLDSSIYLEIKQQTFKEYIKK